MSRTVAFFVAGTPITQGSKRAFVVNGKPILTESGGDRLKLWRHAINDEARKALGAGQEPLEGPVAVSMDFYLLRPASAPKRRRTWPTGAHSGDVDKYARAGLDAMAAVLFKNDAQVVSLVVRKDWTMTPGPGATILMGPGAAIVVREVVE